VGTTIRQSKVVQLHQFKVAKLAGVITGQKIKFKIFTRDVYYCIILQVYCGASKKLVTVAVFIRLQRQSCHFNVLR